MITSTSSIPMDALLAMLNSMNRHDRRWLVDQLSKQVEQDEREADESWKEFMANRPTWADEDNANLDAFLANVSGEWGGEKEPSAIARELRQGSEGVRNVETW